MAGLSEAKRKALENARARIATNEKPAEEAGFFDRIGSKLDARGDYIKDVWQNEMPNQNPALSALDLVGGVAGGINDLIGESVLTAVSALPDVVKDPFKKLAGYAASTETGQEIAKELGAVADAYGRFSEAHPDAARHINAGGNIAAALPVMKATAKAANTALDAPIVRDILADQSGAVGKRATSQLSRLSTAESLVYRRLIEKGMTHEQAIEAVKNAGRGNIPLSLPEQVDSADLLAFEKRLRQNAGKAADIERAFTDARKAAISEQIPAQLGQLGNVQSLDVAGERIKSASSRVLDVMKSKRTAATKDLYQAGYMQKAPKAAIKAVNDDPLLKSVYTSMQKDARVASRLKEYPKGSIGWLNEAKKELDGLAGKAERAGDSTALRDYSMAALKMRAIIDENGGDAITQANKAFAKASVPINKAEQSLLGVLNKMKDGDVAGASQKIFAAGSTPAQIRYARRMVRAVDPQAWDDMVASHLSYVGEKIGHSPAKFLTAIGAKEGNGSVFTGSKFRAALSKDQSVALDNLSESLAKASKIKMGSDTAMNQEAAAILNAELTGGREAVDALLQPRGKLDLAKTAWGWVDMKVRGKRYEELARIFTGQGSEDFAAKLAKMDPSSPQTYREVLKRIAQIEAEGIKGEAAVAPALGVKADAEAKTPSKSPAPAADGNLIIRRKKALESIRKRLAEQKQSSLSPDIRQDEGLRLASYDDTTGNRTVGIGFNMDSGIARRIWKKSGVNADFDEVYNGAQGISNADAEALGRASYEIAVDDARKFTPAFDKLSNGRKEALVNMSYQMGLNRLAKFKNFKSALERGEYRKAALEIANSEYYRQTPNRARENMRRIMQG